MGLDVDGKRIICEGDGPSEKYTLRVDDRVRAAVRGVKARLGQTQIDVEVKKRVVSQGHSGPNPRLGVRRTTGLGGRR